jgi:hypothetical protein
MFLQVFRGQVGDRDAARVCLGRWVDTLGSGWLGTTAGVTEDGRSVTLARFSSPDAAAPTPARDTWWEEMSALSSEPLAVQDCPEVMTQLRGDSPEAGFVQVLQGRITDLDRLQRTLAAASPWQSVARPDIIGGLLGLHGDGRFTQAVYFTSEQAAQAGECAPVDDTGTDPLVEDLTWFDLRTPWAYAPR